VVNLNGRYRNDIIEWISQGFDTVNPSYVCMYVFKLISSTGYSEALQTPICSLTRIMDSANSCTVKWAGHKIEAYYGDKVVHQ